MHELSDRIVQNKATPVIFILTATTFQFHIHSQVSMLNNDISRCQKGDKI